MIWLGSSVKDWNEGQRELLWISTQSRLDERVLNLGIKSVDRGLQGSKRRD